MNLRRVGKWQMGMLQGCPESDGNSTTGRGPAAGAWPQPAARFRLLWLARLPCLTLPWGKVRLEAPRVAQCERLAAFQSGSRPLMKSIVKFTPAKAPIAPKKLRVIDSPVERTRQASGSSVKDISP